jgi:putative tryptophan/tyrosine transport system substrate-binding protein
MPDIILAGAGFSARWMKLATTTVPIVFAQMNDPVGAGIVESLARPGANVTGFALMEYGTSAKLLELLKRIAPRVTRTAVISTTRGGLAVSRPPRHSGLVPPNLLAVADEVIE